ncbi:peptidase PmbA [Thermoplasmatales archaeon]|nr:peptidase PmbA [Thermoplasmatales archaeon]
METIDRIYEKLSRMGMDEIVINGVSSDTEQLRFSNNSKDLLNQWYEIEYSVFAARGKRMAEVTLKSENEVDAKLEELRHMIERVPENPSFFGINPKKETYGHVGVGEVADIDLQDLCESAINGATDAGAERSAGFAYLVKFRHTLRTSYNEANYNSGGTELVIRSFLRSSTGQESIHFGPAFRTGSIDAESIGRSAGDMAVSGKDVSQGDEGKFTVLMSPYLIGNIISSSSEFLSYYSVDSAMSCFAGKLGFSVSSDSFTLVDDPLDMSGVGFRPFDDEGTPTRRNAFIEKGVLKKYMQSYSTGKKAGTESTGNAGVIAPSAWQMRIEPGTRSFRDILSEVKDGLFINNTWYTRYQDYRNGVFSTVPRDGVFRVKNGEIVGSVSGIRISDSVPAILKNVAEVSKEIKNTKWWEEIQPSMMPYVRVNGVNISRSF